MAEPNPDLLDEVAWWQTDAFGQYPRFARSPASAPRPAGRACRCARHARAWPSAPATPHYNDQFGAQRRRSSDAGAAAEPRAEFSCR